MATGVVKVTVVDVGQGQCTFVEIYNTSSTPKLIHALLFDCGSDKQSDETQTNLDYIATKVLTMDTPGFDCIFFSHSDKDHISLAKYVLDKIWETTKPVVREVIYGGDYDNYTKYSFNILKYIEDENLCDSDNIFSIYSNSTNYEPTSKSYTGNLWHSTDNSVYVYKIVGNVLSSDPDWDDSDLSVDGATAEAKNRVSLVCGLYYAGASYVICGDATNITMGATNRLFADGTTVFDNNKMTTLPHHGSRATGFAVKSSESASFEAIAVVSTFSGLLKSRTLTVSAYQKHRHPSLQLMTYFIPKITTPILRDPRLVQKNSHRLTAYLDISVGTVTGMILFQSAAYSFETLTNTFATRYFDGWSTFSYNLGLTNTASPSQGVVSSSGAINGFACWQYETQTNGSFLLGGYANLALPLTLFTGPTVTLSSAEHEPMPEEKSINAAPVSARIKSNPSSLKQPVQSELQFLNRLNQFH
ncbi:hypothetical protein [Asinibacterium sp. OR53]|uniref:hypothetical protein n=1 Tax=Asinibacterium sp. OR53 TaxID=925409 RepID=UPI00047E1E85|nr:hypothetical protein [Asinibacterium sp. OR53]